MKVFFKVILFFSFFILTAFSVHKYYFSVTKIEINTEEKLIKGYSQVFADDFEKMMSERFETSIKDFNTIDERTNALIGTYIHDKMKISVNRKPLLVKYLGSQLEGELFFVYFEALITEDVKRLDIENKLLMDIYTQQHNTVDVKKNKKVQSLHLNTEKTKGTLYF